MDIMNFAKSLIGVSGLLLLFTFACVVVGSYLSYKDGQIRDRIDSGVEKIDTIVTNSEIKLNNAGTTLLDNNALVLDNLGRTITANEQLRETNEQLRIASAQLQQNYEQIAATLNKTIETKEEAIKAQKEAIKAQDEIIGQLTGGNSYPGLSLKKSGFYLTTKGSYGIPNLKIIIRIIPNCLNIPKNVTLDYLRGNQQNQDYIKPVFIKTYPKLWAGLNIEPIDIKNFNSYLPNGDGVMNAFEIYFESDHKRWVQRIRIISHNGKWEVADILDEIPTTQRDNNFSGENEIYKHVSENFPYQSGTLKIIPFFNARLDHPTRLGAVAIEYNHENGISDRAFDSL